MQGLERVLAHLSLFEHLRPDEVGRVAAHFRVETVAAGTTRAFEATVGSGHHRRALRTS